jgi:hypothetical protein
MQNKFIRHPLASGTAWAVSRVLWVGGLVGVQARRPLVLVVVAACVLLVASLAVYCYVIG